MGPLTLSPLTTNLFADPWQVVLNESYPELGNPSILPGQRVPLSAGNLPIKSIPGGGRKKLHRIQAAELQSDGPDGVASKTNDTVDSGGKSRCVFLGCGEQGGTLRIVSL
jgi:hypothetical protein